MKKWSLLCFVSVPVSSAILAADWRILPGFSLVILGFAAGAWIGGHFLVAVGAGLAGPVEVLGYGVVGAIGTVVLSVTIGAFRLQGKQLRTIALTLVTIATTCIVLLSVRVANRKNTRQEHPATSASPRHRTSGCP